MIVQVLSSHPDRRLHGYVGEIADSRGHEALVRFRIRIANEIDQAWVALRHLKALGANGEI